MILSFHFRIQSLLRQLITLGENHMPLENDGVSRILLQLSRLLSINTVRSGQPIIHSVSTNSLYALYLALLKDDSIKHSLEVLACPHSNVTSIATAKKSLISVLQNTEASRLISQFKSIFPRFYVTVCSCDLIQIYLEHIIQDENTEDTLSLLSFLIGTVPSITMTLDLQLRFYAILHSLLRAVSDDSPFHLRQPSLQSAFVLSLSLIHS